MAGQLYIIILVASVHNLIPQETMQKWANMTQNVRINSILTTLILCHLFLSFHNLIFHSPSIQVLVSLDFCT